ncbi:leukocyte elastase inhibitor-like [Centruroides sculpturatus]|uniref:leukocyte elastase inhibitor-like n=1 Tax=Centruroides sculpturatus TaxID=218467 RepID=UPI000C6DE61F|nr:leukocyte elastase inhibitor-like [Centruroides sculpturatus]
MTSIDVIRREKIRLNFGWNHSDALLPKIMYERLKFICLLWLVSSLKFSICNTSTIHNLVSAINTFSVDVYHKITDRENHIFSPYCLATSLSMIWLGTREKSRDELDIVLNYRKAGLRDVDIIHSFPFIISELNNDRNLITANGIFVNIPHQIIPDYKRNVKNVYNATAEEMDFNNDTIIDSLNQWIRSITNSSIETVITKKPSQDTLTILISAVYFKGNWIKQFDKKKSRLGIFYNHGTDPKQVSMMSDKRKAPYGYNMEIDSFILELEFLKGVSMYLVLPRERKGFQQLEANLTSQRIREIVQNLYENEVEVTLPKFKIEKEYEMNTLIQKLGASSLFDSSTANFSGMSATKDLFLSSVLHRSSIDVNEEGTEGTSSTAVVVETLSLKPTFIVDHPFFFFIHHHQTGLILFMGKISEL